MSKSKRAIERPDVADHFNRMTYEPARLVTLVDGVFAIVVTLLVLDIKVPSVLPGGIGEWLLQNWVKLLSYGLSFFLTSFYWINHHNTFHYVKRVNRTQLWLNLIFLFSTGLMPFSTALVSEHVSDRFAPAIFALNLLTAGLMLYAIQRNLVMRPELGYDDSRDDTYLHRMLAVRVLAPSAIYVPIIVVSLLGFPIASLLLFLLIPVTQFVLYRLLVSPLVHAPQP